jgi:hypothetical protein
MAKRSFEPEAALLAVLCVAAVFVIAGCPGAGPDTSRTLASIAITGEPAKLAYTKGEALDLSGLEVTATYSDGVSSMVEVSSTNISYDSEATGDVRVTVTVQGKKAFFTITVTDPVAEALAFEEAHAAVLALSPASLTLETAAEQEPGIDAALAAYGELGEAAQNLAADQKETLDALKSRIDELLAPGRADAFKAAHETTLVLTLDTVTEDNEAAIDAAIAAYNELNEAVEALLTEEKILLDNLKQRAGELKEKTAFEEAHAAALALTAETVSPDDEAAVDAALAAYTELSEGTQALAATEKVLLDNLKITIADLRAAESAEEADRAAAAEFVSAYEAILGKTEDTVAVDEETAVDAALAAYNALTPQAKALVGARKVLLDSLKTRITDTKTAEAFRAEHAAVLSKNPSAAAIADEDGVDGVIAAYDTLSPGTKTLLAAEKAALDALKQSITALKEAVADRSAAEAFRTDHAEVLGKTIGSVIAGDETIVNAALSAYNALGSQVKTLLAEQKSLLDSLKEKIDEYKAPADAAGFKTIHAAILGKTIDSVAMVDESGVNAALLAYNRLSVTARALAIAEKELLDSLRQKITALKGAAAEQNARDNIRTAADFAKIGSDPAYPRDAGYTLIADLVLNDWTPLCPDEARAFSGTFNGNGHTITITSFNNAAVQGNSYIGIFGYVKGASSSAKALIRNVKVVSSVNADSTRDGGQSVGLIAGYANMAVIENIVLQGSLQFSALIGVVYAGGVAGWIEQETVVRDCDSSMNIIISGGYDVPLDPNIVVYSSVGGFVGLFKHRSEIRDCHNTGNVTGGAGRPSDALVNSRGPAGDGSMGGATTNDPNHAQAFVGGIAGGSYFSSVAGESGDIYNCTSYGDIYAGAGGWWAFAAGISGCFQGAVRMERCVVGGTLFSSSQFAYVGGMTAYGDSSAVIYKCNFVGAIPSNNYDTWGPITGKYGQVIECEWNEPAPEPAPQAGIDFSGKLTGLEASTRYQVSGVVKSADAWGCIGIEEAWFGYTVAISRKTYYLFGSNDHASQNLTIPPRPAIPPTGLSAGSGAINGVNTSMEWAPSGTAGWNSASWTACLGDSITGLATGTYYVRYKHTDSAFASVNAIVTLTGTIMSAEELKKIGVDPAYPKNGVYSLGADITLSNWTPLEFSGSFNGNGHNITIGSFNTTAGTTNTNYIGIFSRIIGLAYNTPGIIENLNISVGSGAYTSLNNLAPYFVGTLAGSVQHVLLSNIHVDGAAIAFNAKDTTNHLTSVGGIAGEAYLSAIKECSNSAAITVSASRVGGIAGFVNGSSTIDGSPAKSIVDACYVTGSITASSADSVQACVGGIAGSVSFGEVKRNYFDGAITVVRGNDWLSGGVHSSRTAGIGGIAGSSTGSTIIEDSHSSGLFSATSTNSPLGRNDGMALGGIVGLQSDSTIQRCYSIADLNIQRNTKVYAGGIAGFSGVTAVTADTVSITTMCVSLNTGINLEKYGSDGIFNLHRVVGEKAGNPVLTRNIAWDSMPLSIKETGQAAQPFTEASADRVKTGVAGGDCDQMPTQQDYTDLGWDFNTVWRMGSNGYPELR